MHFCSLEIGECWNGIREPLFLFLWCGIRWESGEAKVLLIQDFFSNQTPFALTSYSVPDLNIKISLRYVERKTNLLHSFPQSASPFELFFYAYYISAPKVNWIDAITRHTQLVADGSDSISAAYVTDKNSQHKKRDNQWGSDMWKDKPSGLWRLAFPWCIQVSWNSFFSQ